MSIHVEGPFGGCDEQAETDAYHDLLGYARADMLFRILAEPGRSTASFTRIARGEGFTEEEIEALLHLQ